VPKTREWVVQEAGDSTGVHPIQEILDDTGPTALPTQLVCLTGPDLGTTFRISGTPAVIGRGEVELRLSSRDVSRRHAVVSLKEGEVVVEDLRSANGTFVNGVRIEGPARLQLGDRLQVGNTILLHSYFDQLEARMQQAQRVEAVATLAAGLAHDFRNALTVIVAGLDEIEERLPAIDAELRQTLEDMKSATSAATSLAERLLNLGRRDPSNDYAPVSLDELVAEVVAMARHILGKHIRVTATIAPETCVLGSAGELHQVLMNLVVNAKDAMPAGGTLTIAARVTRIEPKEALECHLPTHGEYVELTVRDTGTGMDEWTRSRIFEPFFTSKPSGVGTGLGLSVVHSIVRRHRGAIFVESTPGKGACFRMLLPLCQQCSPHAIAG